VDVGDRHVDAGHLDKGEDVNRLRPRWDPWMTNELAHRCMLNISTRL
jgi:hypothetical protein